jgi:hypothetical protein
MIPTGPLNLASGAGNVGKKNVCTGQRENSVCGMKNEVYILPYGQFYLYVFIRDITRNKKCTYDNTKYLLAKCNSQHRRGCRKILRNDFLPHGNLLKEHGYSNLVTEHGAQKACPKA